jgi:hypothetical protein
MKSPNYTSRHLHISEADAIERFHPERIKIEQTGKISKTQITKTRWELRLPNTELCHIISKDKYDDLFWWNGENWVYITTKLIK